MSEFYIDPALHTGRPENWRERLPKEIACYDLLEKLEIPFMRADHSPADTIAACEAVETVIGVDICKNLFLCNRAETKFYMLMMPGRKPFKTKDITKQIGSSRLSFAGDDFMMSFLGLTPGSVSILGLMNDAENRVQLVIDRDVLAGEHMRCHPCINTSTLRLRTSDMLDVLLPALGHVPMIVELPDHSGEQA